MHFPRKQRHCSEVPKNLPSIGPEGEREKVLFKAILMQQMWDRGLTSSWPDKTTRLERHHLPGKQVIRSELARNLANECHFRARVTFGQNSRNQLQPMRLFKGLPHCDW